MSNNQTLTNPDKSNGQHTMVTLRLGPQTYALPIEPIQQIIEMVSVTPISQVNHSVAGVINFHGAAVPVVDLRRHLGVPEASFRLHTPIILVRVKGRMIGLIVDEVMNVLARPAGQVMHPDEILPDGLGQAPLLKGLIQVDGGMVLLLDLEQLFGPNQAGALERALAQLPQAVALETELQKAVTQPVIASEAKQSVCHDSEIASSLRSSQ
jgi:chemotaxis signal transduction protein